ncbi:MAG: ACP S-malonyltransferase [bacterium]|nr:ACP S-malonyltransferase [bacterium]
MSARVGVLFPGQGVQYVGMGKALYETRTGRAVLEVAGRAIGERLLATMFEGPQEALTATDMSQPAIYAVSVAAWEVFREEFPQVEVGAVAGLSLGEYTALTAGGALALAEGVRLVQQRGLFMQEAAQERPGTMASVLNLAAEKVAEICARIPDAYVANYNCPGQVVISGSKEGIARASEACMAAGAKRVIPLQVSGAFHSPFMGSAQARLRPLLEEVEWREPHITVLANVTGTPYTSVGEIPELLGRQVVESVRWEECCRWMLARGIERFIELGPGKVLQGLMKKIEPAVQVLSAETPAEIGALDLG